MAEKSSSTVPIVVALIGVLGTIAAATIANWDKLSGGRERQHAAANSAGANGAGAMPAAADTAIPVSVDVSGPWYDADGYQYQFEQKGTHYSFHQLKDGVQVGSGDGSLVGHSYNHRFTGIAGDGRCAGEIASDGNSASGLCTAGGQTWDMRVVRGTGATEKS